MVGREPTTSHDTLLLLPPMRISLVSPGLFRGADPVLRNFRFLRRLNLRTIVSLTPEAPSEDLITFAKTFNVRICHMQIARNIHLSSSLAQELFTEALGICSDETAYPCYVHCLDGRRITSLLVLLLRRLQRWTPSAAFKEFWKFQHSCRPPSSFGSWDDIEKITIEAEAFVGDVEVSPPLHA